MERKRDIDFCRAFSKNGINTLLNGDNNVPGNYTQRQIQTWSKQYRATETHTIPAMERLLKWFPSHLPASEQLSIVHGDFRYWLICRVSAGFTEVFSEAAK